MKKRARNIALLLHEQYRLQIEALRDQICFKKSCKTLPVTPGLSYQPTASDKTRIGLRTGLKRALEQTSFGLWGKMNSNRAVTVHVNSNWNNNFFCKVDIDLDLGFGEEKKFEGDGDQNSDTKLM